MNEHARKALTADPSLHCNLNLSEHFIQIGFREFIYM